MNGLPQLRTDWMPDIGNSLLRAEQIKQTRMQNQLAQQQMAERPGERNYLIEQRERERQKFGWEKQKAETDSVSQVMEIGKSMLANVPSSKEYGPAHDFLIRKFSGIIPELPQLLPAPGTFKNEEDFENQRARLISSAEEILKLRRGESATMSKVNPDGTINQVTAKNPTEVQSFSQQGYQLGKTTGTPQKPEKSLERIGQEAEIKAKAQAKYRTGKEPTPGQALTRISSIRRAMATLEKANAVTEAIIAANPALKDMLGQKIDDTLKTELMSAWQDELDYLQPFAPGKPKPKRQEMSKMPSASQHTGRTIEDTVTRKRYKSDGINWVEIK